MDTQHRNVENFFGRLPVHYAYLEKSERKYRHHNKSYFLRNTETYGGLKDATDSLEPPKKSALFFKSAVDF
ncbi:hypothetical protein CSA56_05930 [candidate division KSB3 bacterium]|uniref:Uncharacterized protein n=1 Tax=candidate division KSB3 bacterium TaxID=2044937 RepID=A0A2G6KH72_9BACT|nr:MAG: hypothetical protein CSA56_05930 [candidate division KSB3 bacterium]